MLPDLEQLESFGWIFTPTRLAAGAISAGEAVERVQASAWGAANTVDIHPTAAWYTEKGRFRMAPSGIRTTLYLDHPVWVVTIQGEADGAPENALDHIGYGRHLVVDAFSGRRLTALVAMSSPGSLETWDLEQPLEMPELTERQAIAEVLEAEGNEELRALPISAEYGSWQRLIPGCIQIIDVWKIVVDTSSLRRPIPVAGGAAPLEAAWLVLVDDKAGHAWLNTSQPAPPPLTAPQPPRGGEGEYLISMGRADVHRVGPGADERSGGGAAGPGGVRVAGRVSPLPLEGEGTGERGQRDSFVSTQTSRYDSVTR